MDEKEDNKLKFIKDKLEKMSNVRERMNIHYLEFIDRYSRERRDLLKHLGLISAGASALTPQLWSIVVSKENFFIGVSILLFNSITSLSYSLLYVEKEIDSLTEDLKSKNEEFRVIQKPTLEFLDRGDISDESFRRMVQEDNKIAKEREGKNKKINNPRMKRMDYISEYTIWFFIIGTSFVLLSLIDIAIKFKFVILYLFIIFILIMIFSTFSNKIFIFLGWPIDKLKDIFSKK